MTDIQNVYFENSILTAGPVELVRLLMRRCVADLQHARVCIRERDIAGRSAAISHASEIIAELICALDEERAPEYSGNARKLYAYILEQILEANFRQQEGPLTEAQRLMEELADAWENVKFTPVSYEGVEYASYIPEANYAPLETCVA